MRICSKCDKKHYAKNLCEAHYKEYRELTIASGKTCSLKGCKQTHYAHKMCRKHYKAEYKRNWRNSVKDSPEYKLEKNLRNRHNQALKKAKKHTHAIKNLGCTIDELKQYIESQFEPGMTWENRGLGPGKWQIDHIIPFSEIDIFDEKAQKIVCHYKNLRPIWFEDHKIKSAKERWSSK